MTTPFLPRLQRDERGVSAIEFAMIAPFVLLFYFALIDVFQLVDADRRLTSTASTIGDLVAQESVVGDSDLTDVFAASRAIMEPFDTTDLKMRVSSIRMDADGNVEVSWSKGENYAPLSCGSSVAMPDGVLTPGDSVILAEVVYDYRPKVGAFLSGVHQVTDEFYLRPRRSLEVTYSPPIC
jgi:Flp pilus assembly protein TadG